MTEKEEKNLLKNTIEEERSEICNIVRKLGSKLSGLMITCGFLVFVTGVYLLSIHQNYALSTVIFTGALGFIGGLNILCGLLLLLGED